MSISCVLSEGCGDWSLWSEQYKEMLPKSGVIFKHQIKEDETIWKRNVSHKDENLLPKAMHCMMDVHKLIQSTLCHGNF